jgi:hypothetical protein
MMDTVPRSEVRLSSTPRNHTYLVGSNERLGRPLSRAFVPNLDGKAAVASGEKLLQLIKHVASLAVERLI